MNLQHLHLSDPMTDIDSERAVELGNRYDDFATHCSSATDSHHLAVPAAS